MMIASLTVIKNLPKNILNSLGCNSPFIHSNVFSCYHRSLLYLTEMCTKPTSSKPRPMVF